MKQPLRIALKFYTIVSKGSKLKFRKFWGLVSTFVKVIGEKLVGEGAFPTRLNRVNVYINKIAMLAILRAV